MKKFKKMIILIAVILMAFTWTACSNTDKDSGSNNGKEEARPNETTYPLTIKDDLGNEVLFEKQPEKIVSVAPANTETIFALGLGDKLVGRTEYCNYPQEAADVPVVGAFSGPNTELIIDSGADVVLAQSTVPEDVKQLLEASGIKVVVFNPVDIDGVFDNIKQIGVITNSQVKASELLETMSSKRAEIVAKVKDVEPKKVFVDLGGFVSVGPTSFIDSLLKEINVLNIAADADSAWPTLSLEKIIESNPDVYISTYTTLEEIKSIKGMEAVEAYKNDDIYNIAWGTEEHDMIQRPGPRVINGLETYVKTIYPDLYK